MQRQAHPREASAARYRSGRPPGELAAVARGAGGRQITIRALVAQDARWMTIEQRLAEIIQASCADALSSTVNLNVDLDVVLCVLAQALLAAFRNRLGPGYATATPDTIQRRFLDTAGTITTDGDIVTVTLNRRTYSPVLRQSDLRADTTIPWWENRRLRFQFS